MLASLYFNYNYEEPENVNLLHFEFKKVCQDSNKAVASHAHQSFLISACAFVSEI